MFEVIDVKIMGEEYKIWGDSERVELLWRETKDKEWEVLYFAKLEDDGITICLDNMYEEILTHSKDAYKSCLEVEHESD